MQATYKGTVTRPGSPQVHSWAVRPPGPPCTLEHLWVGTRRPARTLYTFFSTFDTRVLVVTFMASPLSLRLYSTNVFTPLLSGPDMLFAGRLSSSSSVSPQRIFVAAIVCAGHTDVRRPLPKRSV